MSTPTGPVDTEADVNAKLLKPPGIFRQFWSRHPRLTDTAVVLFNLPWALTFANNQPEAFEPSAVAAILSTASLAVALLALFVRRYYPCTVFYISIVCCVLGMPTQSTTPGFLLLSTTYAVAVNASTRAAWLSFAIGLGSIAITGATFVFFDQISSQTAVNNLISVTIFGLIGCLLGINIGNRRRYLNAILDRSRQLEIERDQQAVIAAQNERNRIAREMHDIVSHSLTVIVALSEGAAATDDHERARAANLQTATTARTALNQMREMLGVLNTNAPDAPLLPQHGLNVTDAVTSARTAGFVVETVISGDDRALSDQLRFAVARVVQESLTNAMRHSPHNSAIKVTIVYAESGITIEVLNDAVVPGTDQSRTLSGGGYGLKGLAERVKLLGGVFEAGPWQDSSWRVFAFLATQKGADND